MMTVTFERLIILITALTPLLGLTGGAAWAIYKEARNKLKGNAINVQQGQMVNVDAVKLLHSDKDYHRAHASAYRDWMLRHNHDPDRVLIEAGLVKKPTD